MPIDLVEYICQDFKAALEKEWIQTNGIGGYASSTIPGINTRKYHGLLVASSFVPLKRTVLVAKLEETLAIKDKNFSLSSNFYPGTVSPEGYKHLIRFRLDPFPVFTYKCDDIVIEKSVFMIHGMNATVVMYEIKSGSDKVWLDVIPLMAFRSIHTLTYENNTVNLNYTEKDGAVHIEPYPSMPVLYMHGNANTVCKTGHWYKNLHYPQEQLRGYDYVEDLFTPCAFSFFFGKGETKFLVFADQKIENFDVNEIRMKEITRKNYLKQKTFSTTESKVVEHLLDSADSFVVKRYNGGKDIISGYPWFVTQGSNTFVSLEGLLLATDRTEDAKEIILSYTQDIKDGLVPHFYDEETLAISYDSYDSSLWFIEAVYKYFLKTHDEEFLKTEIDALESIITTYKESRVPFLKTDEDGMVWIPPDSSLLTRLTGGTTDKFNVLRKGKLVEVNALWYNAASIAAALFEALGSTARSNEYQQYAQTIKSSFNNAFWYPEGGYLYDFIDGDVKDKSIRHNQVFSMSLSFPVIEDDKRPSILKVIQDHLLTPYGLRSLSNRDSRYCPRYEGDKISRDYAYHQGTVWPWLLGHYINAYVKTYGSSPATNAEIKRLVKGFTQHIMDAGLGTISELFDGDIPHNYRGCISLAPNVAEILRIHLLYLNKNHSVV